jgi:hypothetical protein
MTSQVTTNIDVGFPVAGQDNDSQGFRDNFNITNTNFVHIKAEIEDLQNKAVLKANLTNSTLNNDMSTVGTTLDNVKLTAFRETYFNNGTISGAQTIDFSKGNYQYIQTANPLALYFTGWPATNLTSSKLVLRVNVISTAHTVTLPATCTLGFPGELAGANGLVITYPQTGDYYYEFTTDDGGVNIFVRELGRAPSKVQGDFTVTGNISGATIGSRVEKGWQYGGNVAAVPSPFSTQIWSNVGRVVFDANVTVSSGNVLLPNVTADGTVMKISSTSTITTFYANTNQVGTAVRPNVAITLNAGTGIEYLYHASENAWYKTL